MTASPEASTIPVETVEHAVTADGEFTAAHIQQLIDTNNALRESVISIAVLLQEQRGHGTAYPRMNSSTADLRDWPRSRRDSRDDTVGPSMPGARTDRNFSRRRYEAEWQEIAPMSDEAIELERIKRRKAYEGKHYLRDSSKQ